MTTEAEKKSISQLINATTYQDLTDDEINQIIDYRIREAINNTLNGEILKQNKAERDARHATLVASSAKAVNVLESIMSKNLVLRSVEVCNE